jgi:hypothetical protein
MKNLLSPVILAAALALAAGCESTPERQPRETQRVLLAADKVSPDVAMEVITAVEVVLPPGPAGSEGYVWEITDNNVKVLEQMGPLRQGPPATMTFYALRPGRSVLHFVLVRPGEAEATPAAKCEVTVRVSE